MFVSSKGKLYFQDGETFREVKKSCEKLIISSTSTDKVEAVDRMFEASEILMKTNSSVIEFQPEEEIKEKAKKGKAATKVEVEDKVEEEVVEAE